VLEVDRIDQAYEAFKTVRGESSDAILEDEGAIRADFDLLRGQLLHEKQEAVSFIDLFKRPSLRKRCMVGWITMFGAQGTATLVINSTSCTGPSFRVQQLTDTFILQTMVLCYTRIWALGRCNSCSSNADGLACAHLATGSMPWWLINSAGPGCSVSLLALAPDRIFHLTHSSPLQCLVSPAAS
jgi:hypothetical protein